MTEMSNKELNTEDKFSFKKIIQLKGRSEMPGGLLLIKFVFILLKPRL